METLAHRRLKLLGAALLDRAGCSAAGLEVTCPIARHRVDVAGFLDPLPSRILRQSDWMERGRAWQRSQIPSIGDGVGGALVLWRGTVARTVIVECKQARSDFLTDARRADDLLKERARLLSVQRALEERILKVAEPELRQSGTRLFGELEDWDFARSRVSSYREVLRDLKRLDAQLHGESKFWMMAHYRLADHLYILSPGGMIKEREVPPGWGLLEVDPLLLDDHLSLRGEPRGPAHEQTRNDREFVTAAREHVRVRVLAPEHSGRPEHSQRLLKNIAVAGTRLLLAGLAFREPAPSDDRRESPAEGRLGSA